MLITDRNGTRYWVSLNEDYVKFIELSYRDTMLIEQFGSAWVNFLQATWS